MQLMMRRTGIVVITMLLLSQAELFAQGPLPEQPGAYCPPQTGYATVPGMQAPLFDYPGMNYPQPVMPQYLTPPQQSSQSPRSRREMDQRDSDEDQNEERNAEGNQQNFNQNSINQASNQQMANNSALQTTQAPRVQSSAAPNMIGDFRDSPLFYTNGFNDITLPQPGILRMDFSQNTNPLPTDRFYLNYHHYRNAFESASGIAGVNNRFFFATLQDLDPVVVTQQPPPNPALGTLIGDGIAETISIGGISEEEFNELNDSVNGDPFALAVLLSQQFGFTVNDPFFALSSSTLTADGFGTANLDVIYTGLEKTYNNGRNSVEVRLPVLSAPNSDVDGRTDNLTSFNGYNVELGNVSVLLKSLLYQDPTQRFSIAGGFGFTLPTGPDYRIRDSDVFIPDQSNLDFDANGDPLVPPQPLGQRFINANGQMVLNPALNPAVVPSSPFIVAGGPTGRQIFLPGNDIDIQNKTLLFTPFLAFINQPNRRMSNQLYLQADFNVGSNELVNANGDGATTEIQQQDLLKLDYQLEYWLFRKPDLLNSNRYYANGQQYRQTEGVHFKGLAALFEVHGTVNINDFNISGNADVVNDPNFLSGNYDVLTLDEVNAQNEIIDNGFNLASDRNYVSSNYAGQLRSLNFTTGMKADMADGGALTFAVSIPTVAQSRQGLLFDLEYILQYNCFY